MTDKIIKFINSLDSSMKKRLREKLQDVRDNPFFGSGVKQLKGYEEMTFRIRVGKIRVIYTVSNGEIEIIDIDYRGNIY